MEKLELDEELRIKSFSENKKEKMFFNTVDDEWLKNNSELLEQISMCPCRMHETHPILLQEPARIKSAYVDDLTLQPLRLSTLMKNVCAFLPEGSDEDPLWFLEDWYCSTPEYTDDEEDEEDKEKKEEEFERMLASVEYTIKGELTDSDIHELKIMQELENMMIRNEAEKEKDDDDEKNDCVIQRHK